MSDGICEARWHPFPDKRTERCALPHGHSGSHRDRNLHWFSEPEAVYVLQDGSEVQKSDVRGSESNHTNSRATSSEVTRHPEGTMTAQSGWQKSQVRTVDPMERDQTENQPSHTSSPTISSEVTPSPTAPNSETTPNSEATIIPLSKLPEVQTSDQTETEHEPSRTSSANPDSEAAKAASDAVEQLRIAAEQVRIGALHAAERLRDIRHSRNLSQREVAEQSRRIAERERNDAFRVTRWWLSRVEHRAGLGAPKLLTLAEIYKLTVPELIACWSNQSGAEDAEDDFDPDDDDCLDKVPPDRVVELDDDEEE